MPNEMNAKGKTFYHFLNLLEQQYSLFKKQYALDSRKEEICLAEGLHLIINQSKLNVTEEKVIEEINKLFISIQKESF